MNEQECRDLYEETIAGGTISFEEFAICMDWDDDDFDDLFEDFFFDLMEIEDGRINQDLKYLKRTFSSIKSRSEKNKIPMNLTLQYLENLLDKQNGLCAVSGIVLQKTYRIGPNNKRNPYTISIDRIVSKKGYVKGNVRFVIWAVNAGLQNWGLDVALPIWKTTVDFNSTRKQNDNPPLDLTLVLA